MLTRGGRHFGTSHVEGCWSTARSLECGRRGGLRMLLRRICLVLMWLLICGMTHQGRHFYLHVVVRWKSNLVREREYRTSEDLVVVVVVGGSLGREVHRSPEALAAVEALDPDSPGLEGLRTPEVLPVAWCIACNWTAVDVTWRTRVKPRSLSVP